MPIMRKPTNETPAESDHAAYEAYLRKGGSAAQTEPGDPKDVRFTLQIPGPLCQQLDQLRQQSPVKTSRHHWVLEAIAQRIQRGSQGNLINRWQRPKGEHMEASPEVQRALATIQAVIEDLTPEAPLAVDQPSASEVEEARRALSVLRNFFGVDVEP